MAIQYQQPRRRFTVDDYHKMADAGILSEDDRVELIDGEIVQMTPINIPHAVCVDLLAMLLSRKVPEGVIVRVQNPIFLDTVNEPQPDIAILKPGNYLQRRYHPTADDILLVVEVSDSTLNYDRQVKMPLYARAGVAELWIVNIAKGVVEVYTDPTGGHYASVQRKGRGHMISPRAFPEIVIRVEDFLG